LDLVVGNAVKIADAGIWNPSNGSRRTFQGVHTIYRYVAITILPNLRTFLHDTDRVAAACTGISNALIIPAFKKQEVDGVVLTVLQELTRIPAATKSWRIQVGEAFNDSRFFMNGRDQVKLWKSIIRSLMDSEKERFSELLGE
jgi:hypothetical protein